MIFPLCDPLPGSLPEARSLSISQLVSRHELLPKTFTFSDELKKEKKPKTKHCSIPTVGGTGGVGWRAPHTCSEHFPCTRDHHSPTVSILRYLIEALHHLSVQEQRVKKGCVWGGNPLSSCPTVSHTPPLTNPSVSASSSRQASGIFLPDLQKALFMAFLFSGRFSCT